MFFSKNIKKSSNWCIKKLLQNQYWNNPLLSQVIDEQSLVSVIPSIPRKALKIINSIIFNSKEKFRKSSVDSLLVYLLIISSGGVISFTTLFFLTYFHVIKDGIARSSLPSGHFPLSDFLPDKLFCYNKIWISDKNDHKKALVRNKRRRLNKYNKIKRIYVSWNGLEENFEFSGKYSFYFPLCSFVWMLRLFAIIDTIKWA